MRIVSDLAALEPGAAYWVVAAAAPVRDWAAAPGCRKGARFLIDPVDLVPGHGRFAAFDSRADCLRWIMQHRTELTAQAPGAAITAVRLDLWMLGMDAV